MTPLLLPGSVLSLPAQAADRLLQADNGDGALLYLYLLRHGSTQGLSWPPARLGAALDTLKTLGMAPDMPQPERSPPSMAEEESPPAYSTEELTAALADSHSPFRLLCSEVEQKLGKKLSTNDLKVLYTLLDHLTLPPEVIFLIVGWCTEECQRKYGPGRKPYLSQIRKEGFIWARKGIDTAEQAEEHLKKLTLLRSREGEILRLLDLPVRPMVERERSYVSSWLDMGFGDEALRQAYEKTVLKKGSMDWGYMTGILTRWHEKGLHTLPEIQTENQSRPTRRPPGAPTPADDHRAREDMERMRRMLKQMKQEE